MNMNEQQERIINYGNSVFINAGAGTGKTRTMVEKYISLLEKHEVKVDEILAITFTEKAAGEMKERIIKSVDDRYRNSHGHNAKKWFGIRNRIPFAWISTIHSFASRMLRENPLESGFDPSFEVIEKHQRKLLIRRSLNKFFNDTENFPSIDKMAELIRIYKFSDVVSILENCMEAQRSKMRLFLKENPNYSPGDCCAEAVSEFLRVFDIIYEDYTLENKKNNRLDFEEMLLSLKDMLEKYEKFRENVQHKFKYIMVDEFQDTNPLQKSIVDLVKGSDTKVLYVGDGKQSIYKFNGADVSIFNKTSREFDDDSVMPLDKNYRSNPHLIDFFNLFFANFIKNDTNEDYKTDYQPLTPMKGYDYEKKQLQLPEKTECVDLLPVAADYVSEYENIAMYILMETKKGNEFKDFAILVRNKKNINEIEDTLKRFKIPVYAQSNGDFFSRPEIISLKSFVRALYDPYDESNMILFLRSYFSPFSDSQLLRIRKEDRKSMFLGLISFAGKDETAGEFLQEFYELKKIVNISSPGRIIRKIIDKFDYEFLISTLPESKNKIENVNKFVEFADSFEGSASLSEFLFQSTDEEVEEEEATTENENSNSVRIMTIHRSKGLEFKKVIAAELGLSNPKSSDKFYIDLSRGRLVFKAKDGEGEESEFDSYRIREKEMDLEEEKRILYVAFTRAEESLALSFNHKERNKNPGNFRYIKMFADAGLVDESFNWSFGNERVYEGYLNILRDEDLKEYVDFKPADFNMSDSNMSTCDCENMAGIPKTLSQIEDRPYKSYISPTPLMSENIPDDPDEEETEITLEHIIEEHEKSPDKSASTSEKGIYMHRIMENIGKRYKIEEITEKMVLEIGYKNGYDIEIAKEMYECLENIRAKEENLDLFRRMYSGQKLFSEKTVRKRWGKYILSGVIDKLFFYDNLWFLVDFKYSKYNQDIFKEKYRFQMEFYLFLLDGLVYPKPEKAILFYLKDFKMKEVKMETDFECRLSERIRRFEYNLSQKEVR